jgi:hypothetical protein
MKIILIFATEVLVVELVASSVIETTPPPHTVEPLFSLEPVPTLVMPFSGSYAPPVFFTHTGSWA